MESKPGRPTGIGGNVALGWSYRGARMRRFIFTEEIQQALARERFLHPDPRVQQRMEIVLLKSKGETHERIGA